MGKELLIEELSFILPISAVNILLYSPNPEKEFQAFLNVYGGKYVRGSFWSILKTKLIGQKFKRNSPDLSKIADWLKENRLAAEKNGRAWPPDAFKV